ncbi:MAG: DUF4278 domain-containing protein [Prochlorothrix sp.]|nr:DUF4278 domain-containing protein [Prochlorothrix sp.]
MKRTYRGIAYEVEVPEVSMVETQVRGQYRGSVFNYHRSTTVPVAQPVLNLTYRGVEYRTDGRVVEVVPIPKLQPIVSSATFQERQQQLQEIEMVHRANIRRTVEQRIASARAKGNEKLVQLLEAELQQFA